MALNNAVQRGRPGKDREQVERNGQVGRGDHAALTAHGQAVHGLVHDLLIPRGVQRVVHSPGQQ